MHEKTSAILKEYEHGGLLFNQDAVDLPALLARLYNTVGMGENNLPLSGKRAMTEEEAAKIIKDIRHSRKSQHMVDYYNLKQIKLIFDEVYSPHQVETMTGHRPPKALNVSFIGRHKENGEFWAKNAIEFAMLPKEERAKILINESAPISTHNSHSPKTPQLNQRS